MSAVILLLLISFFFITRDATYTTQPLELLNALGFENLENNGVLIRDSEIDASDSPSLKPDYEDVDNHQFDSSANGKVPALASPSSSVPNAATSTDHNQGSGLQMTLDASEG